MSESELTFSPALFEKLCASLDLTTSTSKEAFANSIVALYFSAHWCGPCKVFTPILSKIYEIARYEKLPFEIVFASHDQDEDAYVNYRKTMPWMALPFDSDMDSSISGQLGASFQVNSLPTLIITHPASKRVITVNGRGEILSKKLDIVRAWCKEVASAPDALTA